MKAFFFFIHSYALHCKEAEWLNLSRRPQHMHSPDVQMGALNATRCLDLEYLCNDKVICSRQ